MRNAGKRKGIICFVTMFLVFSMGLVACGREKEITAENIAGYWTVSNVDCNSAYIKDNPDIMDRFYNTAISLNDDGTGESEFLGEKNDVTWKEIDKEHIELYLADGSIYHELYFASKDNTLVWDEKNDLLYAQIVLSKTSNFKSDATNSDKSMTETKEVLAEDSLSIDTDYYSISLPTEWKDQYTYTVDQNDFMATLYEKSDYESNGRGFLANIELIPFGTVENNFSQESYWYNRQYLGVIETESSYHLIAEYSHEAGECSDENYEQYLVMIQGIETGALRNITAKEGVIFTEMTEPSKENINQDNESTLVEINPLPQINWTANLLGEDYHSYLYQNGIYGIDFDSEFIAEHYCMRVSDSSWDGDIRYYGTNNGNYYAVGVNQQDGTIVSCIYEAIDTASYIYENFKESCFYDVEPRIVTGNGTERILLWKCNNGYLIVHAYISGACRNDNDYSNYITDYYSYVEKSKYNVWTNNEVVYIER